MPSGAYTFFDPHSGDALGGERFSCAPGPAGWRYRAVGDGDGRVTDVTLDARGRPVRVEADPEDGGEAVEGEAKAQAFTGRSPAFLVGTARLLGLTVGASVRVRLVDLSEPTLAPMTCDQGWALTEIEEHPTPAGPLPVARYEVADLATGERGVVHLAGDVVLSAPGVELEELDGPPNFLPGPGATAG
jgi:hypothetical protein